MTVFDMEMAIFDKIIGENRSQPIKMSIFDQKYGLLISDNFGFLNFRNEIGPIHC